MTRVILALAGLPEEEDLLKAAGAVGIDVVRRCVDAADLLGAAAAAEDCPVVISSTLPRLSSELVARLGDRLVIGLAVDRLGRERLERWAVDPVIEASPTPQATMQQVGDICRSVPAPAGSRGASAGRPVLEPGLGAAPGKPDIPETPSPRASSTHLGRMIAVWGPAGAPGRTSVALGVAESLAESGRRVCLVDADTYGPSVAMTLGLVEQSSGLTVACRQADAGRLTATALASLTMSVPVRGAGQWRVLGGIDRADRWSDLSSAALERVWDVARTVFDVVIVDVGFCVEGDDAKGPWGRQRNAAALSAIAASDHRVVVAEGTGLGAARLVSAWQIGPQTLHGVDVTLVRNRAHDSGADWRQAVTFGGSVDRVVDVPEDSRVMRAVWREGQPVGKVGRRSRLRRAFAEVGHAAMSG